MLEVYSNNERVVNLDLHEKANCKMREEMKEFYLHSKDTATTAVYVGEGSCIFSNIVPTQVEKTARRIS